MNSNQRNHSSLTYCKSNHYNYYPFPRGIFVFTLLGHLIDQPIGLAIMINQAIGIFGRKELYERPLSNLELDSFAKQLKISQYRGAISRDKLDKFRKRKQEAFILNLSPSDSGTGGTHWVAVIRDNDKVYFFDAYGGPYPTDVKKRYDGLEIISSTFEIQKISEPSVYCGIISLYVIYSYFKTKNDFVGTLMNIQRSIGGSPP